MSAKFLLWMYVTLNFLNVILEHIIQGTRNTNHIYSIWIAIGVIAICEAIEERNK